MHTDLKRIAAAEVDAFHLAVVTIRLGGIHGLANFSSFLRAPRERSAGPGLGTAGLRRETRVGPEFLTPFRYRV
ncbi:hypothetical protein [Paraburkholderia caribensis]|uniref:hypothetical protein n=1 Tax=Paraburkholderia caribensis TaxID=75105 RepID=UPI001CC697AA|nr:hypothetical protein [Paraburkholderia caribensis]